MDQYDEQLNMLLGGESSQEPSALQRASSKEKESGEGQDSICHKTVRFETKHKGHIQCGLDWMHRHHDEVREMYATLKERKEKDKRGYVKFEASGYTFRLYRDGSGFELVWQQA